MELKQIQEIQDKFDKEYFAKWWDVSTEAGKIERLEFLTVALTGEVGEFANIVKKISRDHISLKMKPEDEKLENLKEELTDCFIYLMVIANFLNMDLETEYFRKLEFNKKRFEKYRK